MKKVCNACRHFYRLEDVELLDGICLLDDVFEPYFEDIFENDDLSSCKDLVDELRFPLDQEACDYYEPADLDNNHTYNDYDGDEDYFSDSYDDRYDDIDDDDSKDFYFQNLADYDD